MFQISLVSLYGVYNLIIAPLTLCGLSIEQARCPRSDEVCPYTLRFTLLYVQTKKIPILAVSTSMGLLVVLGFL